MRQRTLLLGATVAAAVLGACGGAVKVDLGHDPDQFELIDDMEDQDEHLLPLGGRTGSWMVFNDGTPGSIQWPRRNGPFAMSMISPPRGNSRWAARTYGQGFAEPIGWSNLTANLLSADPTDAGGGLYDASAYRGVRFWARIGPNTQNPIRMDLDDLQTDPRGGLCQGSNGDADCYSRFGKNLTFTTEWTLHKIAFSELKQKDWGTQFPGIDLVHANAITFEFTGSEPFDLWVDDIEFFR